MGTGAQLTMLMKLGLLSRPAMSKLPTPPVCGDEKSPGEWSQDHGAGPQNGDRRSHSGAAGILRGRGSDVLTTQQPGLAARRCFIKGTTTAPTA